MTNKSKGDYAYTIVDVDSPVTDEAIADLKSDSRYYPDAFDLTSLYLKA